MSSGSTNLHDKYDFIWAPGLEPDQYIEVTYYVESPYDPEFVAIAIAKEQSAVTNRIPLEGRNQSLASFTARVTKIVERGLATKPRIFPEYHLNTPIYQARSDVAEADMISEISIAYPINSFGTSITSLWNTVAGEVHRLGFITALNIESIKLPETLLDEFIGPRFGVAGLRELLGVYDRPLFCRSTRPAVGLQTEVMVEINRQVLTGGFDIVKDDELTYSNDISSFGDRVYQMSMMVRDVEQTTGEKKIYVCNTICSPLKTFEYADVAVSMGADAFLVAPAIQGVEICNDLANTYAKPILCHNVWQDVFTRAPRIGMNDDVLFELYRLSGADMIIMPGNFATKGADQTSSDTCINACFKTYGSIRKSIPVLAGGKSADKLYQYLETVKSIDFMLIVATAVDEHPGGLIEGAKAFRASWNVLS